MKDENQEEKMKAFKLLSVTLCLLLAWGFLAASTQTPALRATAIIAPTAETPEPVAAAETAEKDAKKRAEPQEPRPDAPSYAVRGPYAVGTREFVIETPQRAIPVTVWYPALRPGNKPQEITYKLDFPTNEFPEFTIAGKALHNAAPDKSGAPYPLLLHVHAAWSFRQEATYLVEHLASHGFVVIAPAMADNWGMLFKILPMSEISRPLDASRTLDFAEELTSPKGALRGLIDMEHVAVSGWSWGGQTTLELAGARLNTTEWLATYCTDFPADKKCIDYPARLLDMAKLAGLEAVPEGLWPDWRDPRVDAIVPLAPVVTLFGGGGLDNVTIPVLLMVGSADSDVGPGLIYRKAFEVLPAASKTRIVFENAEHLLFMNNCTAQPGMAEGGFFVVCSDPVWDMDRAHDLVNHLATAFLQAELKGDAEAAAALAPEVVKFPGVMYETTGYGVAP
jgi:predicted dienelactone hydrolase